MVSDLLKVKILSRGMLAAWYSTEKRPLTYFSERRRSRDGK
jgi:hypothetical protein